MSTTQHGTQVRLPKLGESVTEGTLGAWLKQVGDRVKKYEPLVEITTDKVSAEVPSPIAGTLVKITAQEGDTLPVGAEICVIDQQDGATASPSTPAPSPPTAASHSNGNGSDAPSHATHPRPDGRQPLGEVLRQRSSPAVRRIAAEHGIEIAAIKGTGLEGRVTKSDILEFIQRQPETETAEPTVPVATEAQEDRSAAAAEAAIQETVSPARPAAPPSQPSPPAPPEPSARPERMPVYEGDRIVPLTPMRRQIAEHMVRSERVAPHVTTWMEVDMSRVVAARNQHKARFAEQEGFELTYLPFVIKATVHALRTHPAVNAVWDEDRIIQRKAINIGVAVSLDDGLIVPVIRQADEKSILGLARAMRDLVSRARANRLTIDDIQGGTFTVNNPGTFGTVLSTPIIVQPQAAILSTEAIIQRPVVVDDMFAIRPLMNLSLSIDHRLLDGMIAARFLGEVKRWLEEYQPQSGLD